MSNQIFCESCNAILKNIKKEDDDIDKEREEKNRKLLLSGANRID
jgi:hypothetical protein